MIKLTIEDLQEIADFKVIEKPLIQKPLISEADVVTIDNNLSTYVTGTQKRELTVNLGYMDREGYEVLRGFRDRQYENLKYPKATITSDVEIAPDGQIVEGEITKSFNLTTSDNKLDVKSIELAKIGTNEDYVFKDGGKYYVHKAIGKIASYDGETITTSYISTTGALTTGATVYYVLSTPEEYEITKGTLIELKYAKTYAGETTIWSGASDDSLPTKLDYTYSKAGYLQPVQITDSTYERLTDTLDTPVDITKLGGDTFQAGLESKNLLNATAEPGTLNSLSYYGNNEYVYLNGKVTADSGANFADNFLPAGTYQLNVELASGSITTTNNGAIFLVEGTGVTTSPSSALITSASPRASITVTVSSNSSNVHLRFWGRTTETFTNAKVKYQLVPGSVADYNFQPYINLFDKNNANVLNAYIDGATTVITANALNRVVWIECKPSTTYSLTFLGSNWSRQIAWARVKPAVGTQTYGGVTLSANATSLTIPTGADARYLVIRLWHQNNSTETWQQALNCLRVVTNAPNPDYPQDVVVVTGTQKVIVNNKNLAKQENGTANYVSAGQTWTFINGSIITSRTNVDAQGGAVDITSRNASTWASSTGSDHALTKNGGDYTISFSRVGNFTPKEGASNYLSYIYVNTYNNSGNVRTIEALNLVSSTSNKATISLAENEHIGSIVHYSQYVAFENLELKIQLEEGSTATSFVQQQSQEYTLELAKDYFDISTFGMGGMNSGHLYELNYRITNIVNPLEVKPSTQYTISVKLGGGVKGFRLGVHQLDKNKNFLSDSNWQSVYRAPYTFTTRSDTKYIGIVCSLSTTSTNVTTGGTESQTAYTSPSEWLRGCEVHIHEPTSDIELCSINDEIGHHLYQDYFYKSGGKWWLHKETGKQIPNMNDVDVNTSYANIEYATIPKPTDYVAYGSYSSAKVFCTHAQWAYLVPSGWNSASNVNKIYSNAVTTYNWLGFPKNTERTAIITKLAGCIIYYPLATPTNTEVANEELIANLDNLWSTYGCEKYTTISTEADDSGNAKPVLEVTQGDITGKGTEFTLEGTERIPMTYKIFGQAIQDGTPSTSTPVPIETVKGNNSVTFTGPSGQIDYSIVGKMTLADQRIIDNCGTAEQVQVVFRESKQI